MKSNEIANLKKFKSFVVSLDNEDRYDWIRAAGKANQLWNGGKEGLNVFDEWSSDASNYNGFHDCAYHYNSLNKNKVFNKNKPTFRYSSLLDDPDYEGFASNNHIYSISKLAKESHPYLKSHLVQPYGIRQYGELLLIPMFNLKCKLCAFQYIDTKGNKKYPRGSRIKNLFYKIGEFGSKIIFCEGFATGTAIHQATKLPVIVTFNENNLRNVPSLFREKLPRTEFYIAADDDFRPGGSCNVGIQAAQIAAKRSRARVITPSSRDYIRRKQDFCDVLIRDGMHFLKKILEEQIYDRL